MRLPSNAQRSLIRRYSCSLLHLRVRNATIAARPSKNSERLRQRLSSVYASDTRSGSREFQASSAMRAFWAAVSLVNGGSGGRDMLILGFAVAASVSPPPDESIARYLSSDS